MSDKASLVRYLKAQTLLMKTLNPATAVKLLAGIDPKNPALKNLAAIFIEFPGVSAGTLCGLLMAQFFQYPLRHVLESKSLLWKPDGVNTFPNAVNGTFADNWFHATTYLSDVPRGLEAIRTVLKDLCVLPLAHIAVKDFDTGEWRTWFADDLTEPFEKRDKLYWAAVEKARKIAGLPPINPD